ncbi:MAG: hypothetical protein N2235_15250 [Fischerella sp.]|nr:hypothetical protein [Fischerella sp.]
MSFLRNHLKALVGIASVTVALAFATPAISAPTKDVTGGLTSVELDGEFVNALSSLNVTPKALTDSTLIGKTISFPISGGAIDLGTIKTEFIHLGGLSLSTSATTVELSDFIITTLGDKPVLTGLVTAGDNLVGRIPLFELGLPELTPPLEQERNRLILIELDNVNLTLTAEAAQALNQAFGVTALTAGTKIGVAHVDLTAATQKHH